MIEPLIPLCDNDICGEGMCEEGQKALDYPVTAAGLAQQVGTWLQRESLWGWFLGLVQN